MQLKVITFSALVYLCASLAWGQEARQSVSVTTTTTTVTVTASNGSSNTITPADVDEDNETTSTESTNVFNEDIEDQTMLNEEAIPVQMQALTTPWLVTPTAATSSVTGTGINTSQSSRSASSTGSASVSTPAIASKSNGTTSHSMSTRPTISHNFSKNPPSPTVVKKSVKNDAVKLSSTSALWGFVLMAILSFQ